MDTHTEPTPHWSAKLEPFRPCSEALEYARSKPNFAAAWRDCERGDWMLWILDKIYGPPDSASRRALIAAAYAHADQMSTLSRCASIVRRHYPNPPRLREGA